MIAYAISMLAEHFFFNVRLIPAFSGKVLSIPCRRRLKRVCYGHCPSGSGMRYGLPAQKVRQLHEYPVYRWV